MYSTEDEQKPAVENPQKVPKTSEYSDDEEEPAVKCIVMYSTQDEQEPAVKKLLLKASKISNYSSTEDEQGPAVKNLQKASKIPDNKDPQETSPAPVKQAKIPKVCCY